MKQKIGDWTEEQFETKVKKIVTDVVQDVVDETVERKLREIRPPWVDRMLELLDISAGNYKKVDESQELLTERQSEQSEEIEALDIRVSKVEKKLHN